MELTWEGEPKTMTQCRSEGLVLTVKSQTVSLAERKCDLVRIQDSSGVPTLPGAVQELSLGACGKRGEEASEIARETTGGHAALTQSAKALEPVEVRRLRACLADKPKQNNLPHSSTSRHTADTHLIAQLHYHLQQLSPQRRRELIAEQLTQTQRLALEQWMLRREAECLGRKISQISSLRCCGRRGRANNCEHTSALRRFAVRNKGHRICLSLDSNFYVQSGLCKHSEDASQALKILMRLRKEWQQVASQGKSLKLALVLSVNALRQSSRSFAREADGLRFRTQLSFGRGHRLSSPLRRDPAEAFEDWRRLTAAWKHSLFSGSQLRSEYSPDLAEKQWSHSCRVWRDIWIRSGRCPQDLERSLRAKEAALGPRWAKAKAKWHRLQAQISAKISALLESWSHRRAGISSKELMKLSSNARLRISLRRDKRGIARSSVHGNEFAHSKRPLKACRRSYI